MHSVPGPLEQKAAETLLSAGWNFVRSKLHSFFHRTRELKQELEAREQRIQELERELAEERSGDLKFERLVSTLVCRHENDGMYWKKGTADGPYCPLCLNSDQKLVPLTHGNREGCFYCRIHDHHFETAELRQRERVAAQNRAWAGRPPRVGRWS